MARIATDPNYTAPTFSRATAGTDLFVSSDVQGLAAAMSTHRHNGVNNGLNIDPPSNSIHGGALIDSTVSTAKIPDSGITTPKLADGSITTLKLAKPSVTSAELFNDSVISSKILSGNVQDYHLAPAAFGNAGATYQMNQGAVTITLTGIGGGYSAIGGRRTYTVAVQINSAGSAGQVIEFKMFPAYYVQVHSGGSTNYFIDGMFQYTTAAGLSYWGVVVPFDANTLRFICTAQGAAWNWLGINPAFTMGVNDRLAISMPFYL